MQAMELQMAAERTKRAVIIKSEGERERDRVVNQAQEGEYQSRLIDPKSLAEEAVKLGASKLEMEAKGAALLALSAIADTLGNKYNAVRFQLMHE
jgi:regulator of protease activity HflC (stomatin/prohibitin superfamily)